MDYREISNSIVSAAASVNEMEKSLTKDELAKFYENNPQAATDIATIKLLTSDYVRQRMFSDTDKQDKFSRHMQTYLEIGDLLQAVEPNSKNESILLHEQSKVANDISNLLYEDNLEKLVEKYKKVIGVRIQDLAKYSAEKPADRLSINGKPTKLSLTSWELVRTTQFRKWFGDWITAYKTGNYKGVSKVINSTTLEPLVVYHGTGSKKPDTQFTVFEHAQTPDSVVSATDRRFPINYFAANQAYADSFAEFNPNSVIYPVFLRILNPIDFTDLGIDEISYAEFMGIMRYKYKLNLSELAHMKNFQPLPFWSWIRNGFMWLFEIREQTSYDGLIYYEHNPQDMDKDTGEPRVTLAFATFYSNQIKLAYDLKMANMTRDFVGNDIRFEKGGNVAVNLLR